MDEFKHLLESWDGKTTAAFENAYQRFATKPNFVDQLLSLLDFPPCQPGASWLLKKWLENGGALSDSQLDSIYNRLSELTYWETKLHILQSLPYLSIKEGQLDRLEPFIRAALQDKKKFVVAWGYNGMYELAKQHPMYEDEAMGLFLAAMETGPASVNARVRNILKKGF